MSNTCVNVYGLEDDDGKNRLEGWAPGIVHLARPCRPRSLGFSPALFRKIVADNLGLLHVHGIWLLHALDCIRWVHNTDGPLIVSPHGMLDDWALKRAAIKKMVAAHLFENKRLSLAGCLHALCEAELKAIRKYGLRNPVCTIPNGVDIPEPDGEPPNWRPVVPRDKRIVLYLGRLHPKKGLDSLIRAWSVVQRQNSRRANEWTLVIAGWDQLGYESKLRQVVKESGVESSVHFVGPQFGVARVRSYYEADAFALPSLSEGLPMVVLEAWACKVPVIFTPACNLENWVTKGAALSCNPTAGDLAGGLSRLFEMSDAERASMGMCGYELTRDVFTWPKIARQFMEVYEWQLGGGAAPEFVDLGS